jgi:hypothetical protein
MTKCKVCEEKQIEIDRILVSYGKDKRRYEKLIKDREKFWFRMFWIGTSSAFVVGGFGIKILPIIVELLKAKLGV